MYARTGHLRVCVNRTGEVSCNYEQWAVECICERVQPRQERKGFSFVSDSCAFGRCAVVCQGNVGKNCSRVRGLNSDKRGGAGIKSATSSLRQVVAPHTRTHAAVRMRV